MWVFRSGQRLPVRRQQLLLTHDAQHTFFPHMYVPVSQSSPDLAVSLAVEDAILNHLSDLASEFLVRQSYGTALLRTCWMLLAMSGGVVSGSREAPDGGDPSHTVRLLRGRRKGAAHGFDFHSAKGRLLSSRAIFS